MPTVVDPEALLRAASLRVTRPRRAVLEAVHVLPHSDTDTLTRAVRQELGDVSTQAIYDVLRALTSAGLVRRIEPAGSAARYEARVGDNHHHVVCRDCGTIADVDCAVGHRPCLTAAQDHGFQIDEAEVTYWGVCASCASARSSSPSASHNQASPAASHNQASPAALHEQASPSALHNPTSPDAPTNPTKD